MDTVSFTTISSSIIIPIVRLQEDSSYVITVLSNTDNNTVTAMTKEAGEVKIGQTDTNCVKGNQIVSFLAAPSAAPTSVSISDVTSSNITVQWRPVDCIHQNGNITGYSVRCGVHGSGTAQIMNVAGGATTVAIITDLDPATNYSIEVAAVNSAGTGVYSAIIYAITKGIIITSDTSYLVNEANYRTPNLLKILPPYRSVHRTLFFCAIFTPILFHISPARL